MNYTEEEKKLIEMFKKGAEDKNMGCINVYDFGTDRKGLTERTIEYLKTLGKFEVNEMYYGVEFYL